MDAPKVDFEAFKQRFRELAREPDTSSYRQVLVDATRAYVGGKGPGGLSRHDLNRDGDRRDRPIRADT